MTESISRMQFLSGNFGGAVPIRPPWALEEDRFIECCNRCGECITRCPHGIINEARGKFPVMDFSHAGCDFCGECVSACQPGALSFGVGEARKPWLLKARILENCLSLNGVICRSCGEACESESIRFRLHLGGKALPVIELDSCTGCGECYAVCPVKSIAISPLDSRDQVA
ncbi:MAG: ferredoxin-type protein NapF [Gammaproteobacteria bacterium]|nr:ferredoxin-type protein NapF [Gammaproteobacteria bacterium]